MSEDLLWKLLTVLVSIVGAWATMRAELKQQRRDLDAVVAEQDAWRANEVQLATATRDLTHFNNRMTELTHRLDKFEAKIDRLLERERV